MGLRTIPALLLAVPLLAADASRVAILTAAARAYTSHEFDPVIRNPDWMADAFLSPDEIALLDNHPMGRALNQDFRIAALDPEVSGLARPVLVATRYIDDHLQAAVLDGFTQFVFLNAGFDTRPYRMRSKFTGKRVVEVDAPATQALKKQRVRTVLGDPPEYLAYVSSLAQATVLDPAKKNFFCVGRRFHARAGEGGPRGVAQREGVRAGQHPGDGFCPFEPSGESYSRPAISPDALGPGME